MKKLTLTIFFILGIATGYFISTHEATSNAALVEGNESHNECQYPTRPLVNGQCDNSEPANIDPQPSLQPTTTVPQTSPKPSCKE